MRLKLSFVLILLACGFYLSGENLEASGSPSEQTEVYKKSSPPTKLKHPGTDGKPSSDDKRGTEESPFVIKGTTTTRKSDSDAEDDRKEREVKLSLDRELTNYTWYQVWAAYLMAVIAIGQIWLFWRQLDIMNRTPKASEASIEATRDTVSSLSRIERAYVFAKVDQASIPSPGQGPGEVRITIKLLNYGKTPAMLRRARGEISLLNAVPMELVMPTEDVWSEGLVLATGPNISMDITLVPLRVTPTELETIQGERTIYCMGLIEYGDVFGNNWETGFCWHYNPQTPGRTKFDFTRDSALNRLTPPDRQA